MRNPPAPYDINWRMAYVGTVCFVDAYGDAVHTIRYAAAACDDPHELVGKMTTDLRAALKKRPDLAAGIVQDGAPEMWNRTREGMELLRNEGVLQAWHEGIDRYHLMERLGEALKIVSPNDTAEQREATLQHWNQWLDTDDDAIDSIEQFLRLSGQSVRGAQRETLRKHLVYLENNKDRMRYVALRDAGLPIGSGVTESAAKTVINQRAKGAGQRWREAGLRGVITLRALHQSDRLPRFWSHLARTRAANVQAHEAA